MLRSNVPSELANRVAPTEFINKYRKLNRDWRPVPDLPDRTPYVTHKTRLKEMESAAKKKAAGAWAK